MDTIHTHNVLAFRNDSNAILWADDIRLEPHEYVERTQSTPKKLITPENAAVFGRRE